ncbi:MAG: hypothetical protein Q8914_02160 [Bacteroidota bacterium]|nr:hypothetical protein [Bacteroidota bacterium]
MKNSVFTIACLLLFAGTSVFAQSQKELIKEHKEMNKQSASELNAKSTKTALRDAKKLTKEGWMTTPGALPLDKQLDRAYKMQYEFDDNQYPKYIMAEAFSVGESYDAAKMQALELAKQNLAGQIQTQMTELVDNTVSNQQLKKDEAASIVKTITTSKNLISQNLGRVIPVVEAYMETRQSYRVLVRIAYNSDMAKQAAVKVVRDELEKEGQDLHEQLDAVMGLKNN